MEIRLKLTESQKIMINGGNCLNGEYYHIPFWFKKTEEEDVYAVLDEEDLPERIKKFIEDKTPITKELIQNEPGVTIFMEYPQWGDRIPRYRTAYKKGNLMIVFDARKPHLEIVAADVLLNEWLPERPEMFRCIIPCPTIEDFRSIIKLLES